MPAPKKQSRSETYQSINAVSKSFGERGDCAVITVATACVVSYERAHEALRLAGRKDRAGTFLCQTERAIESLGFKLRRWTSAEYVAKVHSYGKKISCITTHHPDRFPKHWATGTFLFSCSGHILCVKDGVNHDWTRGRAKRVIWVHEVTKA